MPGAGVAIQVAHLVKRYGGRRGVEDLSFSVAAGEIFGFLGPNGAGKTTTIRALLGLIRPTGGQVRIFGRDCWREAARVHRDVGYIPADLRLYDRMTARDFLRLFAKLHGGVRRGRIEGLADRLKLDLRRPIRHLAPGDRSKVGLVQALMHEAPLLVLDEPTAGLEPLLEVTVADLLREEQAGGRTVFLASHKLSEVERLCDRVAIIREGRLVALEPVEALKAQRVRQMSILFRHPIDPRAFETDGIVVLDRGQRRLCLAVRGDINPLLRTLARYDVQDLSFSEPDLDEVFLHVYQEAPPREPALRA